MFDCSKTKMEMTTPVISTGGQQGPQGDKMQFPIERKYGEDPETLPLPNDSKYVLIYHLENSCAYKSSCASKCCYMHPFYCLLNLFVPVALHF